LYKTLTDMNQKNQLVAAIDIGTTKIVTLLGRISPNNRLEILAWSKTASKGVKRGVVLNIEETVNAIQTTVDEVKRKTGQNFQEVYVGIAGQHIKSILSRGYINRDSYEDEITNNDIESLIRDMHRIPIDVGEEIIHVIPQSYIVDNESGVKNPVGMSGKRLEGNFHIVIGQIAAAKNMEKCVKRVGLRINNLILEPLASSSAVLTDDEKEAGVALVDIGGGTTDLAVYHDGIIRHTAVIPFGGNVITEDIRKGCQILLRQAEALKVQYGSALGDIIQEDKVVIIPGISGRDPKEISFKSLAYIIQSRMEEILDAVVFEIENSGSLEKLSAGIVLTGGGAMLKHLPQLVRFRTGLDVRVGYPGEHLAPSTGEDINQPMFATSIGLLLKGYENGGSLTLEEPKPEPKPQPQPQAATAPKPQVTVNKTEDENEDDGDEAETWIEKMKKSFIGIFEEKDARM
jgi:cell division protein FtsA